MKKMKAVICVCTVLAVPFLAAAAPDFYYSEDPLLESLASLADFPIPLPEYEGFYKRLVDKYGQERVFNACTEMTDRRDAKLKPGMGVGNIRDLYALMGASGDRVFLPYLERKTWAPESGDRIRSHAAQAYVMIAAVDECMTFLQKLRTAEKWPEYIDAFWRFLDRLETKAEGKIPDNVYTFLLGLVQDNSDSNSATRADKFLLAYLPEYVNSQQRATLQRFTKPNSAWSDEVNKIVMSEAAPIKAHFDAIPPSERPDLRDRFPDLPPLPEDPPQPPPPKPTPPYLWPALGILAALVALILALILRKAKK